MALDVVLMEHLRRGSGDMWRGWRKRLGLRALLLLFLVHAAFYGILWLLGDAWQGGRHRDAALGVAGVLLPTGGLLAACAVALLDSLHALIVSGPFLRSAGDLLAGARARLAAPDGAGAFGVFASPQALARLARLRDLPLILFVARSILQVDVKPVLQAARTGIGQEELIREVELRARDRAARTLRRWRGAACILTGLMVLAPFAVGWALR
jgi:hypothetical protein